MRSVRPFRTLVLFLCLLVLASLALVGCGDGDEPPPSITTSTTTWTGVSTPEIPTLSEVQVPDLVGLYFWEAGAEVEALDLVFDMSSSIGTLDPSMEACVVEQRPDPGTWVLMGSTVEVTWATLGYEVPDVVGMSETDAVLTVNYHELNCEVVYVASPWHEDWGNVIAQDPSPGTLETPWNPIRLDVGRGAADVTLTTQGSNAPVLPEVQVPNVFFMLEADAISALSAVELGSHVTHIATITPGYDGLVIHQEPDGDSEVPKWSTVHLWVGVLTAQYPMPDVLGMTSQDARDACEACYFAVVEIYQSTTDRSDWGNVVAQDPAAGTLLQAHSEVRLTIGKAVDMTTLPKIPTFPSLSPPPIH
jgi:beta-lactam-binding protein with PASTA domain